jgi:hypothetical protein
LGKFFQQTAQEIIENIRKYSVGDQKKEEDTLKNNNKAYFVFEGQKTTEKNRSVN